MNVTEGEELRSSCIAFAYPEATFSHCTMAGLYKNKEFPQSGDSNYSKGDLQTCRKIFLFCT